MTDRPPSRVMRVIRKAAVGLLVAAAVLTVTYLVFEVLGAKREKAVRARWAQSAGSLEEFQRNLPQTQTNAEAKALEALAAKLGMAQELSESPWKDVRGPLSDYVTAELEKPAPGAAPPPEVVSAFLSEQAQSVASLRKQLLEGAVPVWESRRTDLYEAPIPRLLTLLSFQKILAAEALVELQRGSDATAAEDLEASWRLHQALAARPEMISALVDMALLRIQAGLLRKQGSASPVWRERLGTVDPRAQLLTAYKVEACGILEVGRSANWTRIMVTNPRLQHLILAKLTHGYVRLCAANGAGTFLDMVELLRSTDPCARDTKERVDAILKKIPRWNFFAAIALSNLTSSWQRADRMKLDLELTSKLLQAREARDRNGGRWPEAMPGLEGSACKGERWSYTLTPERVTLAFSGEVKMDPGKSLVLPMSYEQALEPAKVPRSRR